MRISQRLKAVADLVPNVDCVADVGTDHGYIPIHLVEQGKVKRAIAMDINQGPLLRARQHIDQHKLTHQIESRCSDGLEKIRPGEVQAIVIAGMGGITMKNIIRAGHEVVQSVSALILQPQSEIKEFRSFLYKQGYQITIEKLIFEDRKYYPMMLVETSPQKADIFFEGHQELSFRYGPRLLETRQPILYRYLQDKKNQMESLLLKKLSVKREKELKEEQKWIEHAITFFKEGYYDL
jgi:tRNA (adenine22-N1)-methyltransferase